MQPIFGTSVRVFYTVRQDYCWRLALRHRDRPLHHGVLHLVRATRPARIGPITPFLCVSQLVISDEVESAIGGWGMSEITVLPECSEEAAQWILERRLEYWSLPGQRTPVCGVVPTEFESYCRLLHPALRVSNGHAVGVRWENIARELGVELQGGTAWEDLASGDAAFSGLWHQAPRIGSPEVWTPRLRQGTSPLGRASKSEAWGSGVHGQPDPDTGPTRSAAAPRTEESG